MGIQTVPFDTCVEDIYDILEEDGCAIINDIVSQEDMDYVEFELGPYFDNTPNSEGIFYGFKTKRFSSLLAKSEAVREFATHGTILGVMDKVLGPYCSRYQINLTQAIQIGPGELPQVMHPDDPMFPYEHPDSQCMVNTIWAYSDFTAENGATRIVPGSHTWGRERLENPEDIMGAAASAIPAEMSRGSVLIYYGSAWHSGGENRSAEPRTGLVLSYNLGWLRQTENQYLAVPPETARTLSPKLQELLGYAIHEPNVGWYEGQDPRILFDNDRPGNLAAKDYVTEAQQKLLEMYYDSISRQVA